MRLVNLCRHKTAGWDGFIFVDDNGTVQITNGVGVWIPTPHRMETLEIVAAIDTSRILEYMAGHPEREPVAALLQGELPDFRQDVEYLAGPMIKDVRYEISDEHIRITSPNTCFVDMRLDGRLERESLLDIYRQVLQMAKAQRVRISYSNHMKRTLMTKWEEYESSIAARAALFRHLVTQARVVEARGIHCGCSDDKELSLLTDIRSQLMPYGYRNSILFRISSIASQLEALQRGLAHDPDCHSMIVL